MQQQNGGDCPSGQDQRPECVPKTWGLPVGGPSFNADYPTEFRPSQIAGAGNGWFALVDIPKGTRLRRASVAEGTLLRFSSQKELMATGWQYDELVNYGIGHRADPSSIYFLNPGTAMNHADRQREASVRYNHDEKDVFELITTKDIKAGEEMFNRYDLDFAPCEWYDALQKSRGNVLLPELNEHINALYDKDTAQESLGDQNENGAVLQNGAHAN